MISLGLVEAQVPKEIDILIGQGGACASSFSGLKEPYTFAGPVHLLGIPTSRMWAPSRVLEPPFKAGAGSSLHRSPALPIFSAKHALAKEKVTEKKTAGHGQKTWSPDELVTPASVSFHYSRCQWCTPAQTFDDDDTLKTKPANLWNSWSSAGMLLKGLVF
ncbi:hypothetical protein SADUNF_Sadunf08G0120300 [Salix dunnii]|uniref:Uncharacterized protein n=1 Tax=Salix dunnii TaxID=1413687 RepID=A0A835JY20_9ROSI|nr:hypothetical protein SADUNF_Sadunf08G0120300 [Salix dunnii]